MCIVRMFVDIVLFVVVGGGGVVDGDDDDNYIDLYVLMCWMIRLCIDRYYMLLVKIVEPVGILYA